MARILSIASAALFLLLGIADISLWIRGYFTGDTVIYRWIAPPSLRFIQLYSACGGLRIIYGIETYPQTSESLLFSWEPGLHHGSYGGPRYPIETWSAGEQWGGLGFYYYRLSDPFPSAPGDNRLHHTYHGITFPHALVAIVLLAYPLASTWKTWRRHRRHQRGLCIKCGYDLRGRSERCPECGTTANPSSPTINSN